MRPDVLWVKKGPNPADAEAAKRCPLAHSKSILSRKRKRMVALTVLTSKGARAMVGSRDKNVVLFLHKNQSLKVGLRDPERIGHF